MIKCNEEIQDRAIVFLKVDFRVVGTGWTSPPLPAKRRKGGKNLIKGRGYLHVAEAQRFGRSLGVQVGG